MEPQIALFKLGNSLFNAITEEPWQLVRSLTKDKSCTIIALLTRSYATLEKLF